MRMSRVNELIKVSEYKAPQCLGMCSADQFLFWINYVTMKAKNELLHELLCAILNI